MELPSKKIGRPLLVGHDMDEQVTEYLKYLKQHVVAIAAAEGIIRSIDAQMLACDENGIRINETGIGVMD